MSDRQAHLRIDQDLHKLLAKVRHQAGIPMAELARRAIWRYLVENEFIGLEDVPEEVFIGNIQGPAAG